MQIDRRITNGLAWAGVFLVVGVPAADILSAQFLGDPQSPRASVVSAAPVTPAPAADRPAEVAAVKAEPKPAQAPAAKPVEVAAVTPAEPAPAATKPQNSQSATAVTKYMESGKTLPSYISDAPKATPAATATAKPVERAPIVTTPASPAVPVASDPIEVAALPPKVAPVPMPLSMRPQAPIRTPDVGLRPAPVNEDIVLPPSDVNEADLEGWEEGPLSEYLARRNGGQPPRQASRDEDYFVEDDGYYVERPRRDRLIGPVEQEFFFPFVN